MMIEMNNESNVLGLGLRFAVKSLPVDKLLELAIYPSNGHDRWISSIDLSYLPGGNDCAIKLSQYCHVDAEQKLCFNEEEARRTKEYVAKSDLLSRVRAQLVNGSFKLRFHQSTNEKSVRYCNESLYAKLNYVQVDGLLYLGDDLPEPFSMTTGDTALPVAEEKYIYRDKYVAALDGQYESDSDE